MKEIKKVVLAYSGGLDTSVMIPWLKENYNNCEVICVSGDVGQAGELEGLEEKALKTGASKLYVVDLKREFIEDYIFPTLQAGAKYEGKYLLGTAFARPVIAKALAEIAQQEQADAICHGCTGKGNDQVRFDLAIRSVLPDIEIIAPWRTWELCSREDEFAYAQAHNIPLKITRESNYSKDKNIWHLSHEGLDLEDPANEPNYDKEGFLEKGVSPFQAPDEAELVTIRYEQGIPVALNGKDLDPVSLVEQANQIAGKHGIGIVDMIENRLIGMKAREVYENPGGALLYAGHEKLEEICLDRDTQHFKFHIALKYAELVYNGLWFTPLREALQAFVQQTQKHVTGEVTFKLYKGNIIPSAVTSEYSLYDENVVTFEEDREFNHNDAAGFINIYGMQYAILKKKGF